MSQKTWKNIDKTGKYVINLQYTFANSFKEGLARVVTSSYDAPRFTCWFIDKLGNYYFSQPMNNFSGEFHEGLAYVEYGEKKGFIDKTGRMVINTQSYNSVSEFNDGLAIVQTYNRTDDDYRFHNVLTGFIDKTGRIVIKLQYYCARPFSEGLSCVRVGGKYGVGRYGFIDKTGTYVINPQYDYAESFRGGIAPVVINNQFQYIDKKGNSIWTSTEFPSYITDNLKF